MEVRFYNNMSDSRKINKELIAGDICEGQLRDSVSIMNPVVRVESDGIIRYNYAYIPEFQRYYTITDRTCVREDIWDITMEVDVLMSFRNDIINLQAIVDKQSSSAIGDEYIDDGSLVADNVMFTTVYPFTSGFNSTGEYILITAG